MRDASPNAEVSWLVKQTVCVKHLPMQLEPTRVPGRLAREIVYIVGTEHDRPVKVQQWHEDGRLWYDHVFRRGQLVLGSRTCTREPHLARWEAGCTIANVYLDDQTFNSVAVAAEADAARIDIATKIGIEDPLISQLVRVLV